MPENLLIPSVDLRVGALEEYNRRQKEKAFRNDKKQKPRPCVTLSREFGCEGYPLSEKLCELMGQRTGEPWVIIDKAVLEEVAKRHNISEELLKGLGKRNRILEEVLSTFSPEWKSDNEYFQLLCRHVISLAEQGNVIILELGGAIITRHIEHSYHFRVYGSEEFKVASISQRLELEPEEAENLIERQQRQRDRFTRDFLSQDGHNPALYDMLFNNDRNSPEKMACTIACYLENELRSCGGLK
jgi:cytidylate kinase